MSYDKSQARMLIIKVQRAQSRNLWAGGPGKGTPAVALEAEFGLVGREKGREHEEHKVQVRKPMVMACVRGMVGGPVGVSGMV